MCEKGYFLSVNIPVYNAEQYIEECVKSILKQSYIELEIILVDDGSIDKSGFLYDSLAEQNKCVEVLHIKHSGIIKARLSGVKISKGGRITFVDVDDWIGEDAYKALVFENDYDIIMTGICRYFSEESTIMQMPYLKEGHYSREEILNEIIPIMLWNPRQGVWALNPSLCTKIFTKKLLLKWLENASEVESNYGEDSLVISYGYQTGTSDGYMVFYWDENIYSSLDFRRGIVYARK